jgi:hypothetical protein
MDKVLPLPAGLSIFAASTKTQHYAFIRYRQQSRNTGFG